ncbi:MAG TPA: YihA family ribosome biogenesis GTP-binding protein [Firmicutes bacterium]|nr:YihA family ribosome biogenesis GTP-binding protein [Bacillota bacterium]
MKINVHDAEFLTSAVDPTGYPKHDLKELALVGRSNVGKSSLINTLVNRRKFARTSSQPGRTQTLNFYRVDTIGLVDLPGYGFARVPERIRQRWRPMIEGYLTGRRNLIGVLHLVDLRHKPTEDDLIMSTWIKNMDMPCILVATKADKVSRGRQKQQAKLIGEILHGEPVLFSAKTRDGRNEILTKVKQILQR